MWIFFAFLAVPLIEIALFIQVGGWLGLWPTLGIVVLTAVIGTWLVRTQGRAAIGQLQQSFSELDDPTEPLAHGAMILVAGALLLTPGFFTDAVGLALLTPAIRVAVFNYVRRRVRIHRFEMGQPPYQTGPRYQADPRAQQHPDIVEGEFAEVDEPEDRDAKPRSGSSGWTKY